MASLGFAIDFDWYSFAEFFESQIFMATRAFLFFPTEK
tara:strand:- start:329 stop:442 length:114 start_codon:yes stop_codon:yes gene_type:complete